MPVDKSMAPPIFSFALWNGITPWKANSRFLWTKKWTPGSAEDFTLVGSLMYAKDVKINYLNLY